MVYMDSATLNIIYEDSVTISKFLSMNTMEARHPFYILHIYINSIS